MVSINVDLTKTVIFALKLLLMKKLLILFLAFTLNACNDGDFDVPVFEFTETVNKCGAYVLYITNTKKTEVLVLTLPPTAIDTIVKVKPLPISATVTATYRIFDVGITDKYFCQDIPPIEPKIIKEFKAENTGTVNITTAKILKDNILTGYSYEINISNLDFNNGKDRIYHENFNFGTFTIKN